MLFAHAILVCVFIGLPEGHDYFLPTYMGCMEAMQLTNKHGLPKMKRLALVSILALGSLYVIYVDTEQMPVWCAKYHLVGSPWRGPMTTFLQVCKPSYQRQVHFLLSSSLYVMYILGKFEEGIGFNVMGQLWKKDLDDFLNGQFVSEVNKSAIEATQAIVEPTSEGLLGSEGSSAGSPARSKYGLDNLDRTPFKHFSSSGYTPEEIQAVTKVMSLFKEANMEDLNWPEPGNLFHEELNVQLPSEKKSRGKMVGKAIGYVNECPSMIASWCWDYCSDARRAFNHKFDIKRETVSRDSDHSMTIFQQKWFPKPHLHRDFLFKQIWKRLDDHTIIVIYYDDTNSFFNESFFQHRQKEQKTKRAYISNILVLQELLELEDEDGNKFKPPTVMTKVSQLCILDLNGYIDDSLSLTNLRSALSTIKEMQDFFPNEDASSNIRMRSESVDTDLDEAVNDEKEINWDSYQLLQQDADNIDNYLRKVYADVGDVAASEFTDDVEGHAAKNTRAEEAANKFQIGAFSMWAIKNCPDEITMPFSAEDKSSDDPNISSFTKSLPKLKSERKNLFKTSEFDDPVIEAEYFEYYIISNRAGIMKIVWILKIYAIIMVVVMPAFLADQGHSQSLVAMLIMWFMSMLLAFFNQKLLTSLKRGLVSNNSFHLVSGIILVLCLVADSQLINAKIFQTGFSQGETSSEYPTIDIKYHLFIFWFITFQSLTFYLLTTRVEARIGQTHQLFHLIESLARLVMMMGVRVYRLFLYRFFGPVTCIILCMYCTTIRETQFRSTFSVIYARLYEKFSYRLDSLASVLQEAMSLPDEKVEEIQVAIRQHGVGGNANVIGFGCKQIPIEEVEYEKKIGQGSESIVYLARYRNKIVAVKQISISNLNRRSVGSMLSEIKLLADLSHKNIIQLHAAIIPGPETEIQVVGMVLEHAKEGTVSSFLKCHESLDWQDYKRNIALGISKGMKYLHSRRQPIVHRDLKTTNCLLTEWREVKVTDFGASRFYKEGVMTSVVGSKYFMSPEMLCGDRYDVKTDVYSFGSLLADIGMGGNIQRLFLNRDDGPRSMDYNKFMIEGWRPSLPEAWVEEMPTITDLINRCWSHDPNDRPSFAEIKKTLAKWSGKLSRTMRESAVLRASTEYTKEDLEFINDGLRDFNLLSLPPANHKPQDGEPRTNFAYSSLKDNTWRVHLELSINFPSWEVMDYILDWDNPERCAANRLLGETSNSVLHLENEHSKIVETILLTSKTKVKQYVAKLMWKEISKDSFFCWTKTVKDPRWQNANVQNGGSSLKAGWTVVGHPDGKSCHVVHNSSLHVPLLQSRTYYYDLEKFTNRCRRQLHDIAAILKKRKVMKAIEMQKLYDRKIRYQANDYMQENIVKSTNTTNSQDEEVRSVNNNEINSDMPWVSRTAMDQDYRTWRRDNRKITGVGTDGQRNNLPRVGQRSKSRNALNRSNKNMADIAEDGD
ncbi:hypothetical protein TrST_g6 [Triparma strigata]|uniref:Protein kinase domain-containing protein n=1 Tax=Triparma strigata TaxID=1606541 RepID=A0A9W7EC06_9STRA|nr:hypothetical protein TrST_g6 [Triparma strigata]